MESAFGAHIRAMAKELAPRFTEVVIASSEYTAEEYEAVRESLAVVDEAREPIRFERLLGTKESFGGVGRVATKLRALVAECDFLHTHIACNPRRPHEALAGAFALALNKPVVVIADMDHRGETARNYADGRFGFGGYLARLLSYDAVWETQQRAWTRFADLLLFKEQAQVDAYGEGAAHVRLIRDPNYSADEVITTPQLCRKLDRLRDTTTPLKVVYFGRLVPYKGVDQMVSAVAQAHRDGANIKFDIIGVGPERAALEALVEREGIGALVEWPAPRPYADGFLDMIRSYDVLLACPQAADTPRSTWDAICSGLLVVAYDTPFYRSVSELTGAIDITPDRDARAMAEHLVTLADDKASLIPRVRQGVAVARVNTQEAWLRRRADWVEEVLEARRRSGTGPRLDEASALQALMGVRWRRTEMRAPPPSPPPLLPVEPVVFDDGAEQDPGQRREGVDRAGRRFRTSPPRRTARAPERR